jgi:aminomethyltransferase
MSDDTEMRELPLGDWHRAKGARMVSFAGYAMPIQYEGIMAEHLWTRENAGLFDVSHMGQLILSGEGVAAALEKLVPGDISALKEGRMRYSLLLGEEGGVLDDLMVTATPTGLYVVVNGAVKHQDIAYLRANLPATKSTSTISKIARCSRCRGRRAVEAIARDRAGRGSALFHGSRLVPVG